jgi:hypothetical protein
MSISATKGRTTVVDWVKQRSRLTMILFGVFCLLLGLSTAMVIGRTQPATPFWIIFGGNTDPNDDDGVGARRDLIAGGWTTEDNSVQVHWAAAIEQGTARITDESMAEAHREFDTHCRNQACIIAGFSLGNSPALQLAAEVGQPADRTYLFGAPQPAPGLFHASSIDNPAVEGFFDAFSGLASDRPVPAGVLNFFDVRDPYANAAPQCNGPGLGALTLAGHYIISRDQAFGGHIWTGPDGAVNHEASYQPPPAIPASGADQPVLWAACPPGGWYSPSTTPVGPGPAPGVPGGPNPAGAAQGEAPAGAPTEAPIDNPNLGGGIPTSPPTQLPGLPGAGG